MQQLSRAQSVLSRLGFHTNSPATSVQPGRPASFLDPSQNPLNQDQFLNVSKVNYTHQTPVALARENIRKYNEKNTNHLSFAHHQLKEISAYFQRGDSVRQSLELSLTTPDPYLVTAAMTTSLLTTLIHEDSSELVQNTKSFVDYSLEFLKKHSIIMFPAEILLALPFVSPFISSTSSQWIETNLQNETLRQIILNGSKIEAFHMPDLHTLSSLAFIGVFASFMNMGISGLGYLTRQIKVPERFEDYNQTSKKDWHPIFKTTNALLRGGTYALSNMSLNSFATKYADIKSIEMIDNYPRINSTLVKSLNLYGKTVDSFETSLPASLKFFAQTAPKTPGETVAYLLGLSGIVSFYFLYEVLLGTHGENTIWWMTFNSMALAPLLHTLTSNYYGKDTHSKAYTDVMIFFILNVVTGICAGPNFSTFTKVSLDLTTRLAIISIFARMVYTQNQKDRQNSNQTAYDLPIT